MMDEVVVDLSPSCRITVSRYGDPVCQTDVDLCYTESSYGHWYSGQEIDVTITREKAIEIIAVLCDAFNLTNDQRSAT